METTEVVLRHVANMAKSGQLSSLRRYLDSVPLTEPDRVNVQVLVDALKEAIAARTDLMSWRLEHGISESSEILASYKQLSGAVEDLVAARRAQLLNWRPAQLALPLDLRS